VRLAQKKGTDDEPVHAYWKTATCAMIACSRYLRSRLLLLAAMLVGILSRTQAAGRNMKTAAEDSSHGTHHAHRFRHGHVAKNNSITFGVILSAFERESDPYFRLPCANSFYGIARQTYKDWYLLLNGDGISSHGVGRMFQALKAAGVPEERVLFRNMEPSRRERFVYKENLNNERWLFSGVNSLNMALELAYDQLPVTHIARLDEDDVWLPSHLQNLAVVYSEHPDVGFVYTQALGYSNPFNNENTDHGFPHPEAMLHTFRPPAPCELIHSTASWTTDLRIFYRQLEEQQQQLHGRSMEMCCRRPCNTALPADADLWERIHGLVQRKYLASVFVSRADVVYMTSSSRDFFLEMLSNNSTDTSSLGFTNEREDLSVAVSACQSY